MATIKYLLLTAKQNKEGKAPLQIAVYDANSTELIPTGETIKPAFWDKENQRVRQRKDTPEDTADIDEILLKIRKEVVKLQKSLKTESDVEPSAYEIKKAWLERLNSKKELQKEMNSKAKEDDKLIVRRVDKWIANLTHKPLTIKAITNSMKHFKEFIGEKMEMDKLTKELCERYGAWLFEKHPTRKRTNKDKPGSMPFAGNLSKPSHGRHIKHLRWFIKSLHPRPFDFRDLKVHNFRRKIISLTLDELRQLEAYDVSKSTEKQKSKDLFLLACYTALRISDLRRISKSCIHIDIKTGEKELRLTTLKNKRDVEIPILPECWDILAKYDMRAPKIAEQTVNTNIKVICKDAGIDSLVKMKSTKGNKEVDVDTPKHELISIHTGGKTCISLAGERWGLDLAEIASMFGKDIKTIAGHYMGKQNKTAKEKMRERMASGY